MAKTKIKELRSFLAVGFSTLSLLIATTGAQAQSTNKTDKSESETNAPFIGPFAGLAKLAIVSDDDRKLPAKLTSILWPDAAKLKYKVKKLSMPVSEREERLFCLRTDSRDVVMMHRTDTQPDENTKYRRENYYLAGTNGDLVLALSVKFRFEIDDVDNELLRDVKLQTYGGTAVVEGQKPEPITKDIKSRYEAEKKYWLGMQKKLAKAMKQKNLTD
jgi:hypothetical protein